jgi:hypothetical protein
MTIESRLSDGLRELADGDLPSAPTQGLLERGRRARRRRTAVAGASLAVVAAGALAFALTPSSGTDSPRTGQAAVQSPQVRLAAAVLASQSTSYQLKISSFTREVGDTPNVWSGAFDPNTDTGYLHMPFGEGPGFFEERLVDGVDYVGDAGLDEIIRWRVFSGTRETLRYNGSLGGTLSGSVNPDDLLAALSQAGAVVTQNGTGFHFAYTPSTLPAYAASDAYAGDVALDAEGRIASVTYVRTVDWVKPGQTPGHPINVEVTIEFSGYGTPVTVERPTAADTIP